MPRNAFDAQHEQEKFEELETFDLQRFALARARTHLAGFIEIVKPAESDQQAAPEESEVEEAAKSSKAAKKAGRRPNQKAAAAGGDWIYQEALYLDRRFARALEEGRPWSVYAGAADSAYKKMCSRLSAVDDSACEALHSVGRDLFALRLIGGNDPSPRCFLTVHYAAGAAVQSLSGAGASLQGWDGYFSACFELAETEAIQASLTSLNQNLAEATTLSLQAAAICEYEQLVDYRSQVCEKLRGAYGDWREIRCRFERLEAEPAYQPEMFEAALLAMNRAGYYVAVGLRAVNELELAEKSCHDLLVEAWTHLHIEVGELTKGVAANLRSGPCAPKGLCSGELGLLEARALEGKRHAERLQASMAGQGELAAHGRYADRFEEALEPFSRRRFPASRFAGLWWWLAQIRAVVSDCDCEDDDCVLTKDQLCKVVDWIKERAPRKRGVCCEGAQPYPTTFPWFPSLVPRPGTTFGATYSSAAVLRPQFQASAMLTQVRDSLDLAAIKAPEDLRPLVERLSRNTRTVIATIDNSPEEGAVQAVRWAERIALELQDAAALAERLGSGQAAIQIKAVRDRLPKIESLVAGVN